MYCDTDKGINHTPDEERVLTIITCKQTNAHNSHRHSLQFIKLACCLCKRYFRKTQNVSDRTGSTVSDFSEKCKTLCTMQGKAQCKGVIKMGPFMGQKIGIAKQCLVKICRIES